MLNKSGPKKNPCGTPEKMSIQELEEEPAFDVCFWFRR